jgi:hypothetical protein
MQSPEFKPYLLPPSQKRMTADLMPESVSIRRQWTSIFQIFKEKILSLAFFTQQNHISKMSMKHSRQMEIL